MANAPDISWLTAFVDLAADEYARGTAFWHAVTGYAISTTRGARNEFATLVPPAGGEHLRLQRLGMGHSRVHLDVHVRAPGAAARRAVGLGAEIRADWTDPEGLEGYVELRSPGGFPFCFVTDPADSSTPATTATTATPATWPAGQRSRVDQVCLDIPGAAHDAEVAFWRDLTGWPVRQPSTRPEYARLAVPSRLPVRVLLQHLGEPSGPVRAHLDLATDDRAAEVDRLVALGAEVVSEESAWTALRPPVGPPLCVTDRDPDTGVM